MVWSGESLRSSETVRGPQAKRGHRCSSSAGLVGAGRRAARRRKAWAEGGCPCSGAQPGCPSAWGAVLLCRSVLRPAGGAGLVGLARGLRFGSAAHAARRGAALRNYRGGVGGRAAATSCWGGEGPSVAASGGFLLRARLAAPRSLVELSPRMKRFGFTFSFSTSSSIRLIRYTFNCSSFEFSSPHAVPLHHQYLVILLLLLIANTCRLSSTADSGAGARRGVHREDLCALGNLQKIDSLVYPTAYPDFKTEG